MAAVAAIWCWPVFGAQGLYTYTPDYSGHYFDVRRTISHDFVFNVAVSTASPPDDNLIYVGVFSGADHFQLSEIQMLNLESLDNSGIEVKLIKATLGPADVAVYEKSMAITTLLEPVPGKELLPLHRHSAIGSIFAPMNLAGRPGPRIQTQTFRLPLPPESWSLQTTNGYLSFQLTRVGTATIGASLNTAY